MKGKEKSGLCILAVLVLASVSMIGCSAKSAAKSNVSGTTMSKVSGVLSTPSGEAKLVYHAKDLKSLIMDSPLIVVAQASEDQSMETFQQAQFVLTKLKVKTILKNNGFTGDEITLLQTFANFDSTVQKDSTIVLFLEKYTGPIPNAENAYVCKGLYQGNYLLEGDKIVPSKKDNVQLAQDIHKIGNLSSLKAAVDAVPIQK